MHLALVGRPIATGTILDVGGGVRQEYLGYMVRHETAEIVTVDFKQDQASGRRIDLETDALPFDKGTIDQVLCFNVLEHIYHHAFLVGEMARVLKPGAELIGFVPFLMNYHPDPKDYFRYTNEALVHILSDAGFTNIEVTAVGRGPFMVNYHTLMPSLPKLIRMCAFPVYWFLDSLFLLARPNTTNRLPLGYVFSGRKDHYLQI